MRVAHIQGENVQLRELPEDWSNLLNFAKRSESVWNENGFYRIVYPELTATQKHGANGTLINNEYVIEVLEKSPEEIANEAEQQLNSDISQQLADKREQDGKELGRKIFGYIERKQNNNAITPEEADFARAKLYDLIEPLYKGVWKLAQSRLNEATFPAAMKPISDWIKSKVDTYITNSY